MLLLQKILKDVWESARDLWRIRSTSLVMAVMSMWCVWPRSSWCTCHVLLTMSGMTWRKSVWQQAPQPPVTQVMSVSGISQKKGAHQNKVWKNTAVVQWIKCTHYLLGMCSSLPYRSKLRLTLWLQGRGACQDPDILVYEFYFSSFEAGIANAISSIKWRKIHKCSIYLTKICVILWLRSLTNDDGNFRHVW